MKIEELKKNYIVDLPTWFLILKKKGKIKPLFKKGVFVGVAVKEVKPENIKIAKIGDYILYDDDFNVKRITKQYFKKHYNN